jgi:hypothetical protein
VKRDEAGVPEEVAPSTDAIRFTYGVDAAGALALVRAVRVSMTALPSVELDPQLGPFTGFRYELRDVNGSVLWRHVAPHPLDRTVEVFGEVSISRVPDDVGARSPTVVVPALDGADTVALIGAPGGERGPEAVELLVHRFEAPFA